MNNPEEKSDLEMSSHKNDIEVNVSELSQNIVNDGIIQPEPIIIMPVTLVLESPTYDHFIECFKNNQFNKIITIVGAGISTAAGIPDFRSPGKGLYNNLAKYNLPTPQAIFELDYFLEHPAPFYNLAKDLMPDDYKPTLSHYFIKLLEIKGLLHRHYTQNIDGLERKAGISDEKLVEAHGTFQSAHCLLCNAMYTYEWLKTQIYNDNIDVPHCKKCNGIVKPDIVFFGESLPKKFFDCMQNDFKETDLLIIMGSSLTVEPFASLVKKVNKNCTRVIINNKEVGKNVGIEYHRQKNRRDVFIKGSCDEGCKKIILDMKWKNDFKNFGDSLSLKTTRSVMEVDVSEDSVNSAY